MAQSSNKRPTPPDGWLNGAPDPSDAFIGKQETGAQYQDGWAEDRVKLPEQPSDWSLAKALQDHANSAAPPWSLENCALNMVLDKAAMADIDWVERDPADPAAKPGWVQLPQPHDLEAGEHGSGYYTYGTDPSGHRGTGPNYQWGEPRTMEVIGSVAPIDWQRATSIPRLA